MPETKNLSPWVRQFLVDYLPVERNLARNTQKSYRDTLQQLLPFAAKRSRKRIDRLQIEDLSRTNVLEFLSYLEEERGCSVSTRNQRLGAIHSLARFISSRNPEFIEWYGELATIPVKKRTRTMIAYLEKDEMDGLLGAPDPSTAQGQRDFAVLLFLYNTGARADEVAQLQISQVVLSDGQQSLVKFRGKGNKERTCPLWKRTVDTIRPLIEERDPSERVFLNRNGQPYSRFGINGLVKRNAVEAVNVCSTISSKRVTTHVIRHTTATHLLRSGVDINTIRSWLGHVSLATTNVYAEVDLEMKAKALATCEVEPVTSDVKHWKDQPDLMEFLRSL
ncbi:tyrosine-type recombinase/integrase [Fuerstiella marisgermanici]|uniref:Tyrosine recombinase XerD n=1 Tax=Fuerstiella marisgermanici TaxID=1891926 RepID=A0A1P8WQM6_9PLAN|nr:tyrosine-type recombinase/integrase [Fuerstiella marisgermanici]APZ96357.1 Tyrosine recombinase XerD [Fuerstiella marisgermanici]